jgi:hypothetical protein
MAALAVVAATVVFYAPTIHDYFVQDDFGVVGLLSQKPVFYFPRWFVGPWTENIWGYVPDEIRPFPALSYQIAGAFGAAWPVPNHVINIAQHALNGLLVLWIAQAAAGLGLVPATIAALVFVVLPIQAESVAWITGRVDSMPACFYFASFLLFVRWRASGRRATYLWSLVLFFAALFSKQNTITMAPALVLYDWIVGAGWARGAGKAGKAGEAGDFPSRPSSPSRRSRPSRFWAPYVPYILLTAGFLALRYALFHEVAREDLLTAQRVQEFVSDSSRHLVRLVFGGPGIRHWAARDTGIVAFAAAAVALIAARRADERARRLWRPALYFGVIWIALGMAPILVSGYYSPRHVYLASLGWAVTIGIGLDMLWHSRPVRYIRPAATVAAVAIVIAYGMQLRQVVRDWNMRAAVSRKAVVDLEREVLQAPDGTLVIVGVPTASWAFAVPHALRPPFTSTDLTRRVLVVSDSSLHCCAAAQWNDYTRQALRTWQARADHPPVVAMYWNRRTMRLSRVSGEDDPQLRTLVSLLMETDSRETLDSAIRGLLGNFVAVR